VNSPASKLFTLADLTPDTLADDCNIDDLFEQFNASVSDEIDEIAALRDSGQSPIPEVTYQQLNQSGFSATQAALVRKRGCVVIRQTFSEQQAENWNTQLSEYLVVNQYQEKLQQDIDAGNVARKSHPHMLDIYWSKTQLEVRQSEQLHQLQQHMNGLWKVGASGAGVFDTQKSYTYSDRVRIRQPLDQMHGLAPHVDSCSMEAWFSQETVDRTYATLLNGNWKAFDAFDSVGRVNTSHKPHENSVGMFRTYQGWMALTAQGPDSGTLQLVPSSRCVAWMFLSMLRESMRNVEQVYPLPSEAYILHPEKHALLIKGLCSIPVLQAGDTIWWHPDAVHAVEQSNLSNEHSSVIYLGIAPQCSRNKEYLHAQRTSFAQGSSPPDFPATNLEENYSGRGLAEHLNQLGAQQMGLKT